MSEQNNVMHSSKLKLAQIMRN